MQAETWKCHSKFAICYLKDITPKSMGTFFSWTVLAIWHIVKCIWHITPHSPMGDCCFGLLQAHNAIRSFYLLLFSLFQSPATVEGQHSLEPCMDEVLVSTLTEYHHHLQTQRLIVHCNGRKLTVIGSQLAAFSCLDCQRFSGLTLTSSEFSWISEWLSVLAIESLSPEGTYSSIRLLKGSVIDSFRAKVCAVTGLSYYFSSGL